LLNDDRQKKLVAMSSKTIQGAGGIVVRGGGRSLVAVVQRSKDRLWVLPRGKLKRNERPVTAAKREVTEETGHRVEVHDYLGAIAYKSGQFEKVVRFWHMQAAARPSYRITKDIAAVKWLPLGAAIRRLSYPLEKVFLTDVGRHVLARGERSRRGKAGA
jgi:8-oxo-dGTP diphosphatase